MPEYSSTTITPSDGVQVPGMNGSTSGNLLLSALKSYILSEKGLANGLASLDGNGKLTASQLPDLADDVIVVASYASLPATGTAGKIYITADNNKMYRWDPELTTPDYVELSIDLSEYAKIVDIQDGNIQAGVAVKAFQDAMGRAIITTYETKADASDLKDAISFNRKRIENLEQKSGSVVDVDYPEYSVTGEVPTGKAKNAIVSKLRGVTVAFNQLVLNSQFADSSNWNAYANAGTPSLSISGGIGTITCNGAVTTPRFQGSQLTVTNGHTYLLMARARASASCNYIYMALSAVQYNTHKTYVANPSANTWYVIAGIYKSNLTTGLYVPRLYFDGEFVNGDTMDSSEIDIFDITQDFGSQVADYLYSIEQATAGAGVALFKALVSAQDNSHETGRLVSTTYSAVRSVSRNIFDGDVENGVYATYDANGDGSKIGTQSTYQRCVNLIPVEPSTNYYLLKPDTQANGRIGFYDSDGNYLGYSSTHDIFSTASGGVFTTPANAFFMSIYKAGSLVGTCINKSDSLDGTFTEYFTKSLTLPSPVTLRGILKVENNNLVVDGDEYDLESGEISRKYALVNLGDLDESSFKKTTNDGFIYFFIPTLPVPPKRPVSSGTAVPRLCSSTAYDVLMDPNSAWSMRETVKSINIPNWTDLQILDMDATTPAEMKANLSGVYLFYEAATPTSESVDPVLDPTLATEGGGNLSTEQTNDPAIVSALEMTYLTL